MQNPVLPNSKIRIRTIDILRAVTMFLMIFVNDFWTLTGVPKWLEHTLAEEDGMGFSDVIFPLFLFIVGLSIPLAINRRIQKNESMAFILQHILSRTIALLAMGFYMVNYGVINQDAMVMNKFYWQILMAAAIFLIWLDYKNLSAISFLQSRTLKITGILILLYLAWIYRGGTNDAPLGMQPHWWGILGLIGWAYLLNSSLYLLLGKKLIHLLPVFFVLLIMNIQESDFFEWLPNFKLVISASNHLLVMAGVLSTMLYLKLKTIEKGAEKFLVLTTMFGLIFICYGFLIRPTFPISKIFATPSWTAICIGISFIFYSLLYLIVERGNYYSWASPIKPAGTSTLTCYLMPYFIYPLLALIHFQWPPSISTGMVGLLKSMVFSGIIIAIVGIMEKKRIRLVI